MHHPIVLVTGPPFCGHLWSQVRERLESHHLPSSIVELLDPPGSGSIVEATERLCQTLDGLVEPVLVAHGTAIPAALHAAQQSQPAGLVLTNGALGQLDPALSAIARLPPMVLRRRLWLRYLASSIALRRVVVNPYVMDRDTVVAVCEPTIRSQAHRRAQQSFLKDVAKSASKAPAYTGPTMLLWGDSDRLYPSRIADSLRPDFPRIREVSIPGGRHLHPIERPWFIADEIRDWCAIGLTTT